MTHLANPELALYLVECIALVGILVSSLEWLARPRELSDAGIFSWSVLRLRERYLVTGVLGNGLDLLFRYPAIMGVFAVRLALAIALLVEGRNASSRLLLLVLLTLLNLSLRLRCPMGGDGADQMSSIMLVVVTMARLIGTDSAFKLVLWFIALQAILAYLTSGSLKLKEKGWRDGSFLVRVLSTATYGNPVFGDLLKKNQSLSQFLSFAFILFECCMPAVFFLPSPLAFCLLVGGVIFHLSTGVIMGLNTFVWAFVATYPALIYCAMIRLPFSIHLQ